MSVLKAISWISIAAGLSICSSLALAQQVQAPADEMSAGGLRLNPTQGKMGLQISSPSPTDPSVKGQYTFNLLTGAIDTMVRGPGESGHAGCACASLLQATLSVGSKFKGVEAYGGSFGLVPSGPTTTESDFVGLASGVNQRYTGNSRLYGGNSGVTVGPRGSSPFAIGYETNITLSTPTGVPYRSGFQVVNTGPHRATVGDAAFSVESGVPGGNFQHAMALFTFGRKLQPPLAPTGDFFWSESPLKIAHWANLPNVTVAGNILSFPGVVLTGAGKLTTAGVDLYALAPPVPAGHVSFGGRTAPASSCDPTSSVAGCLIINVGGQAKFVPFYDSVPVGLGLPAAGMTAATCTRLISDFNEVTSGSAGADTGVCARAWPGVAGKISRQELVNVSGAALKVYPPKTSAKFWNLNGSPAPLAAGMPVSLTNGRRATIECTSEDLCYYSAPS